MKNIKFLAIFLILCLALSLLTPAALALDAPEIVSRAAILLDRKTGEVLWSQNADERAYPASTTKIMTVLLAVEAVEEGSAALSDQVTASANIAYDLIDDGSTSGIRAGETMTLEDLLYCAMLQSANEACNVIAEHIGGTIPEFVARMNARADALGCTGTHFANTHGLPSEDHYTTAADMSRITLEAAGRPLFMEICGTKEKEIPATNVSALRTLQNSNSLINPDSVSYGSGYYYERAGGVKTGFTNAAGYCLVSTADDAESGVSLLCVVFGGVHDDNGYSNFSDTITLLDWAFDNYSYQDVLDPNVSIASVDVKLGQGTDYVNLRPAGTVTLLLPNDYDPDEFDLDMQVYSLQQGETVTAPVTAGEVLGEVSVYRDGQNCGTVKLVAASSVDLSRGQYIRSHIEETIHTAAFRWIFWGVVLILVLYLAWVILYRIRRIRYRRAVKAAKGGAHVKPRTEPVPVAEPEPEPEIEFFNENGLAEPVAEPAPEFAPVTDDTRMIPPVAETPPAEDAEALRRKADRDYFEEFFRQK